MTDSEHAPAVGTRELGRTDVRVSELTFGTWQVGGARFGPVDADEAVGLVRRAADRGVTTFDTSNVYGNGRAEVIIGQAFRHHRSDIQVVTKVGYLTGVDGAQELFEELPRHYDPDWIVRGCEESLRRLQTDHVDVLLLHDPPPSVLGSDDLHEGLRRLLDAGKVRATGASVGVRLAATAVSAGFDVVEVPVNRVRRELCDEFLPDAAERGIGVLARSPFHNGEMLRAHLGDAGAVADVVADALGFVRAQPAVSTIVVGIMNDRELDTDVDALLGVPADGAARHPSATAGRPSRP